MRSQVGMCSKSSVILWGILVLSLWSVLDYCIRNTVRILGFSERLGFLTGKFVINEWSYGQCWPSMVGKEGKGSQMLRICQYKVVSYFDWAVICIVTRSNNCLQDPSLGDGLWSFQITVLRHTEGGRFQRLSAWMTFLIAWIFLLYCCFLFCDKWIYLRAHYFCISLTGLLIYLFFSHLSSGSEIFSRIFPILL